MHGMQMGCRSAGQWVRTSWWWHVVRVHTLHGWRGPVQLRGSRVAQSCDILCSLWHSSHINSSFLRSRCSERWVGASHVGQRVVAHVAHLLHPQSSVLVLQ